MMKEKLERRWLKGALLLVGFWVLFGLLYGGMNYAGHLLIGEAERFSPLWSVLGWCTWIPTTLLALGLIRRFPVTRRTLYVTVPIHLLGAVLCALFAAALYTAMRGIEALFIQRLDFAYVEYLRAVLARSLAIDSVLYLIVLVGVHAFEYYRRYRERTLQAERLKADLSEAQLHALNLQLQPHFLFNTFHTIAMLVRRHEEEKATDTIASLSDFLRYVLESDGVQEVPLEEELDFLRRYVAIEQARFEGQIELRIDVPPEVLSAQVPYLLLQPLVENAIRHGLRPTERHGCVEVDARREGNRLRMRVRDNGVGLPVGWTLDAQRGIGLSNTQARLKRLYGADHHVAFANAPDTGGLMVNIVIPYRLAAEVPTRTPKSFFRGEQTYGNHQDARRR